MPAPTRPRLHRRGPLRLTVPSRNDSLLRSLVGFVGGPLGKRTDPGRVDPGFWRVERVLLVIVALAGVISILSKQACRSGGWTAQHQYLGLCYSDVPALFFARGFDQHPLAPFLASGPDAVPLEYPVLTSAIASFTAALVPRGEGINQSLAYFDINAFFAIALWAVTVIALAKASGRRMWDAAIVAASPAIILASTINWDLWAVAFLAVGLLAFGREHPVLAGVLLGLGTAVKIFPILALGPILVLAIRTKRMRVFWLTAAGAAGAWVAVNLPFALTNVKGWSYFFTFSEGRGASWSSLWYLWNATGAKGLDAATDPAKGNPFALSADAVTMLSLGTFALCCVGVLVLGLKARRRPRLASLLFLVVAAFAIFNKVYSPQFVVWLVPLAALAYPRWKALLWWQAAEVFHFVALWMFLWKDSLIRKGEEITQAHLLPDWVYFASITVHIVATLWIAALVVRSVLRPETDPVRRVGQDDPLGALFVEDDALRPRDEVAPERPAENHPVER